jgi:RHS repeat-associated protein
VRGRFFVARSVPLEDSASNSIVASTTATTLAGHSPSSDTVTSVALDSNVMWTFSYNANGDLTQKLDTINNDQIEWDYTYDVQGWLTAVEKKVNGQSELVEEYSYDPIGRKYEIETTENQQTTTRYFVYDGGSVLLELDSAMELGKEFVRGLSLGGGIGGLLYVRDADEAVGYFHYDGQGNVVCVTDEAREEIAYYEYDAWGNVLTACGDYANEFRFSTKQASTGTSLADFRFRWYDPQAGRWTQRDPIGVVGGLNLYVLVRNAPTGTIDPWGLVDKEVEEYIKGKVREAAERILGKAIPGYSEVKECVVAFGRAFDAAWDAATDLTAAISALPNDLTVEQLEEIETNLNMLWYVEKDKNGVVVCMWTYSLFCPPPKEMKGFPPGFWRHLNECWEVVGQDPKNSPFARQWQKASRAFFGSLMESLIDKVKSAVEGAAKDVCSEEGDD